MLSDGSPQDSAILVFCLPCKPLKKKKKAEEKSDDQSSVVLSGCKDHQMQEDTQASSRD